MKSARKKIYKECIIVLSCLLMFGSLAQGAVLCFGSEGHISVEFKAADCCDEYLDVPVRGLPDSYVSADHSEGADSCGDCVDIPLSTNCVSKQVTSFAAKKFSPLKILSETIISTSTDNSTSTSKEHIAKFTNHLSDILTTIGNTVLLI